MAGSNFNWAILFSLLSKDKSWGWGREIIDLLQTHLLISFAAACRFPIPCSDYSIYEDRNKEKDAYVRGWTDSVTRTAKHETSHPSKKDSHGKGSAELQQLPVRR